VKFHVVVLLFVARHALEYGYKELAANKYDEGCKSPAELLAAWNLKPAILPSQTHYLCCFDSVLFSHLAQELIKSRAVSFVFALNNTW
jgi:hypothetical protein